MTCRRQYEQIHSLKNLGRFTVGGTANIEKLPHP